MWLTKNKLKLLAAAAMAVDHIGVELLPQYPILRIIGRLAYPIFAYAIFEGCRYTHDRKKYLAQLLSLGLLCVAGYYVYTGRVFGNVLITFSLSVCVLYGLRTLEESLRQREKARPLPFCAALTVAALVCAAVPVDYGLLGVLLPVWCEAAAFCGEQLGWTDQPSQKKLSLLGLGAGLLMLALDMGGVQVFSMLALLILAASSGRRGTGRLKYFFYVFYPAHLMAIGAVAALVD